jgi:hypothetical protein
MNKKSFNPKKYFPLSLYESLVTAVKTAKDAGLIILVPTDTDHKNFEVVADNLDNFFTQPTVSNYHSLFLFVSKGDNLLVSANGNNVFDPANTAKTIDFKRYGRDYYAYYQVDVDESTLFKNIEDKNLTDMFFDILNDDDKKYLYEPEEDEDDEDEDEEEEYNYLDDI